MGNIGVLFDLDGVLIDSEGLYTEFWEEIEKIYPTGVKDFAYVIKGNALFKILDTYFTGEDVKADIIKRVHRFEHNIVYPIFDGVIEFLEDLKSNDIPAAIVTSSDNVKMESLFSIYPEFRKYFNAVITGSDVSHSKPHPEGYLKAAEALGCAPEDCYVFEDSIQGLEAGMASGAAVIGLTTSNPANVLKGKAHVLIDGFMGYTVDSMLRVKHGVSCKP